MTPTHMSSFSSRHRKPLTDMTSPSNPHIKPVRQVAESILNLPVCGEITAQALRSFPLLKHPMGRHLWLILESHSEVQRDLSFIPIHQGEKSGLKWPTSSFSLSSCLTQHHLTWAAILLVTTPRIAVETPRIQHGTYATICEFWKLLM